MTPPPFPELRRCDIRPHAFANAPLRSHANIASNLLPGRAKLHTDSVARVPLSRFFVVLASLILAGCGNFQLASNVQQAGKTQQQVQLDTLSCKDEANLAANTADRQIGAFLLGMTIVGTPIAFEMEKAKKREVFASCMTARGYLVTPPNDSANQSRDATKIGGQASVATPAAFAPAPAPAAPPAPPVATFAPPVVVPAPAASPVVAPAPAATIAKPVQVTTSAKDEFAQLEKLKGLKEKGLITDEEFAAKKKEILDRI